MGLADFHMICDEWLSYRAYRYMRIYSLGNWQTSMAYHEGIMTWKRFPLYWALCEENPPVTGGFPSQRASNVELLCFLCCSPEQSVKQTIKLPVVRYVMAFMCHVPQGMWTRCTMGQIWQALIISHRHHDDVIKWKHFPRHWPFVRGIRQSPVNSSHKGQWRRALMFSLIYAWIKVAGDLRRHRAHYDAIIMTAGRKNLLQK